MGSGQPPHADQVHAAKARRSLRNGFITLLLAGALAVGLLLAVPGLERVASTVANMQVGWVLVAVALEVLSCAAYVVAFLQVFERAPLRVGALVALAEQAFGAAVSLGGVGSLAVGGWLMVERGAAPGRQRLGRRDPRRAHPPRRGRGRLRREGANHRPPRRPGLRGDDLAVERQSVMRGDDLTR